MDRLLAMLGHCHLLKSRLLGVTRHLPALYTARTGSWAVLRSISINNNLNTSHIKSESASAMEGESNVANYPHADAADLARERSEQFEKEWAQYHKDLANGKFLNVLGESTNNGVNGAAVEDAKGTEDGRRWIFSMRHGERVDLTYGSSWIPICFDKSDNFVRKDLNMPLKLVERAGGRAAYDKDTPLTRIGSHQAYLVGEGLRLAGVGVQHVYSSAALRSVATAHALLEGLQAPPSVKVKVDPGLFECKLWYTKGRVPFMTTEELLSMGYNIDTSYKPYVDLDMSVSETYDEFHKRTEFVMQSAYKDTEKEGGNLMFVGHATTLFSMWQSLHRMSEEVKEPPPYSISAHLTKVPYCGLAAMKDKPWELLMPPCPPSINSCSPRLDWTVIKNH